MLDEVQRTGFQGLRADKVIKELGITKGALYYYFKDKQTLGYAIVEELLQPSFTAPYEVLEAFSGNPLDYLQAGLLRLSEEATPEKVKLGCPLNNLITEMSPLDDGFRERLQQIIQQINQVTYQALLRGQQAGTIRKDIDVQEVAHFLNAALDGAYSMGKLYQSVAIFRTNLQAIHHYLESLRP